jgi:hypothetical protein
MKMTDPYSFASRAPLPDQRLRSSGVSPMSSLSTTAQKASRLGLRLLGSGLGMGENQYGVSNMVDTPKVHPEQSPPGSRQLASDEAKLLHALVHEHVRLPQDVSRVELRFGEDSSGAPAVWIVFVAKDDPKPSKSKIASIQRAAEDARRIVRSESNRWPYIEITTE